MTEYRMINDGYWDFLQYKTIKSSFWGTKREKWYYIPDAQFSSINHLENFFNFDRNVSSYNHNLKRWVEKYPYIEDWFMERDRLIEVNRRKRNERDNEIENNKGKITYL